MRAAIGALAAGRSPSEDEVASAFAEIMDGVATAAQIGGLLVGLRLAGETAPQLAGAARAMRARALPLTVPNPALGVDTCGTGGDSSGSVNVSTLAAIIAAAAGAQVAKHGNRALSSRAGSADVLAALGVRIDAPPAVVQRCIDHVGIGFAFAPTFHAATRHAAGPRRELGTRTLFNLLGPMTNPAQVAQQVIGVYDPRWCTPVARALGRLGSRRVFVLHGAGGIDEIAVAGETLVAEWDGTDSSERLMSPKAFGFEDVDPAGLAGGDADDNATILRAVLDGAGQTQGAAHRAVFTAAVMEAALALVAIGLAPDARAGAERAAAAVAAGAAADRLKHWARVSQEPA